jgi:signal transduction histidine kinase
MNKSISSMHPVASSAMIALLTLISMTGFQIAKRIIKPDITLLESNIVSVLTAALVAFVLSYIVFLYKAAIETQLRLESAEREQALAQLREAEKKYRQLDEKLQHVTENEKQTIGHELHDGLGQHLTGIEFTAKVLENKLKDKSLPEALDAGRLTELIHQAVVQTRHLSRLLAPVSEEENGFFDALNMLAQYVSQEVGIVCELHISPNASRLQDHFVATNLFRIVQESTSNAIKHGRTTHIAITVQEEGSRLVILVSNNGLGLPEGWESSLGSGFRLMRHRAQIIGADLRIESPSEGGVRITCTLPYRRKEGCTT